MSPARDAAISSAEENQRRIKRIDFTSEQYMLADVVTIIRTQDVVVGEVDR